MGLDLLSEIDLVLDDTGDNQTPATQTSHLDSQMNSFIRVDPTEENQVLTAGFLKRVQREIDTVIDSGQVVQLGDSIGVADRYEVSVLVLPIDGQDFG